MKNKLRITFLALFLLISNPILTNAQLIINGSMTPTQLVNDNLVWGGLLVDTVTFTGSVFGIDRQIGQFSNGNTTNLGLTDGIVISSGNVNNIPNASFTQLDINYGTGGDVDLATLIGTSASNSYDAAILEFDFVPFSTPVMFNYVFGSEEYNEYVNSNYNDVFGFFLSGPGISGPYSNNAVNIAIIPSTTLPVSINNVNNGYTGGCSSGPCNNCVYFVDNCIGTSIIYDGFTTSLLASYNVVPFQQYHIKLAVSDIYDGVFDSGVFLKYNSFYTNSVKVVASNTLLSKSNKAIEGCTSGIFKFLIHDPATQNDTVYFSVDGTAVNGIDYDLIPSYVVIPAGSDSVLLEINTHSDGINEGDETVILHVQVSPYGTQDITLNISDSYLYQASVCSDQTICFGQTTILSASGGFTYLWNTSETNDTIYVSPTTNTIYSVEISDSLGCSKIDSVHVIIDSIPLADFSYNDYGQGQINFIDESLNGLSWNWDFGNGNYSIEQSPIYTYSIQGNYMVIQIVQNNCGSDTSFQNISIILDIPSNELYSKLEIYPNPNDGNFILNCHSNLQNELLIQIINTNGEIVYSKKYPKNTSTEEIPLNLKGFSKGYYQLKVSCGKEVGAIRRLVIK